MDDTPPQSKESFKEPSKAEQINRFLEELIQWNMLSHLLLDLGWVDHELTIHFCPISEGKIRQTVEFSKQRSTQPSLRAWEYGTPCMCSYLISQLSPGRKKLEGNRCHSLPMHTLTDEVALYLGAIRIWNVQNFWESCQKWVSRLRFFESTPVVSQSTRVDSIFKLINAMKFDLRHA